MNFFSDKMVFVGASTGGTEALKIFLGGLPSSIPGVLVVQHMPETFTRSFASRLNELCEISVEEAQHGLPILPGHAYIAPGHSHLLLDRIDRTFVTALSQNPPHNRHRPSVDLLFESAAQFAGKRAVGVILTGMGKDGAAGMVRLKQAGAYNFAQNEETCTVFGMPKEAIALGAVDEILPVDEIAQRVTQYCSGLS